MCVFESNKLTAGTELINFEPNLAILILCEELICGDSYLHTVSSC